MIVMKFTADLKNSEWHWLVCSWSIFTCFSLFLWLTHMTCHGQFSLSFCPLFRSFTHCLCTHLSVLCSHLPKSISPMSNKSNLFNLRCYLQLWGQTERLKTIFPLCRQIASHKFSIPHKADVESLSWTANSLCDKCRRHLKAKIDWCFYSKRMCSYQEASKRHCFYYPVYSLCSKFERELTHRVQAEACSAVWVEQMPRAIGALDVYILEKTQCVLKTLQELPKLRVFKTEKWIIAGPINWNKKSEVKRDRNFHFEKRSTKTRVTSFPFDSISVG